MSDSTVRHPYGQPAHDTVRQRSRRRPLASAAIACALMFFAGRSAAQTPDSLAPTILKRLSLEELMNLEVTSVSRRAELLSMAASAVQVVTAEDIRRSGASNLAEALRLAPNLQVAQVNASQWAVSARGFNNVLANKLLVLIDGRTVYTPLYAGVFWDVQHMPLDDIDRIEVVSGPGGTLWGANAVNGVINIISKSAVETQGLSVMGGGGTELREFGGLRYGGRASPTLAYRVYGEAFGFGSTTTLATGANAQDNWGKGQGGIRMDWQAREVNRLTFQSDINYARPDPDGGTPVVANGGNALARWTRTLSERADLQLQVYYDRTRRDFRNGFTEALSTLDVDWQHRFPVGERQEVIWGIGARLMNHETENLPLFAFVPANRWLRLYSAFIQDEFVLAPRRLRFTVGSKLEHNDYTGFEVQPSARLAWTPGDRHTVWSAVSRAVRTPARIDRDFFLYLTPTIPIIVGDDFGAEEVLAYELGWRLQPQAGWSFSLSAFYNDYDNLRSAEPGPPPLNLPITFRNGVRGKTHGVELAGFVQASDRWRLRGGYTYLDKRLSVEPGSNDLNEGSAESNDPEHQVLVQSTFDASNRISIDAVGRFVDALAKPQVPSYVGLDVRLGWNVSDRWELSLVGQNLLTETHLEFIPSSPSPRRVERGVYGKVTWR